MPRKRPSGSTSVVERSAYEGEQGNVPGLLDRGGYRSLMTRARTGLSARADLTIFGDVFPKHICFLIVNCQGFICTELTEFGLCEEAALAATFLGTLWSSIFSHLLLQFSCSSNQKMRSAVRLLREYSAVLPI